MKNTYKLTIAALALTIIFTATGLRAQDKEDSDIGLTVGIDYVSNYIYRGSYYYMGSHINGGMISPYAFFDIFNTGFAVGIRGEVSEIWVWDNKDEHRDSPISKRFNLIGFYANYMYEYKKIAAFNIGGWYYAYRKCDLIGTGSISDASYFDVYFSIVIHALPFQPMLTVTYSYYMDEDYVRGYGLYGGGSWGSGPGKNGDLYIQLGISHSFKLLEEAFLNLAAVAGFYDQNKSDVNRVLSPYGPTRSSDISDIDLSAGLSTTAGILTFSMSFHYVIVPGTQYKYDTIGIAQIKDIHKFYTKFGVSCSI